MSERPRQLFAWLVLCLFVLLAGYIATAILGPVLGWFSVMLLEVFAALNLPPIFSTATVTITRCLMIAARCAAIGFAYRMLFEDYWRKAGMRAWAVIVATNIIPASLSQGPELLAYLLTSIWFYAETAVAGAAALAGAWYAHSHRHNQRIAAVRNGLFSMLRID